MRRRIRKALILMLFIGMALVMAWALSNRLAAPTPSGSALTIQQIQGLSALVSMRIELSDVVESQIRGYTGGVKAVLLVKGDVLMSVDLSQARFEQLEEKSKAAVLVLPEPKALSPRLDHRRTRLVSVQSEGLWLLVPSDKDKEAVIDRLWRGADAAGEAGGESGTDSAGEEACGVGDRIVRGRDGVDGECQLARLMLVLPDLGLVVQLRSGGASTRVSLRQSDPFFFSLQIAATGVNEKSALTRRPHLRTLRDNTTPNMTRWTPRHGRN